MQSELGVYANAHGQQAKPFELQADCLAGTWANAADEQGILESGDIEEGLETALAIGDFEYESQQHHGTPEERRDALLTATRTARRQPATSTRSRPSRALPASRPSRPVSRPGT